MTNSKVPIIKEGGDLYVTPASLTEPVGLLVGETGIPDSQINLLLLPAPVPQVIAQVHVQMSSTLRNKRERLLREKKEKVEHAKKELAKVKKAIERGDTNLDKSNEAYKTRITDLLVEVAKENIPKGFSLNLNVAKKDLHPCDGSKMILNQKTVMQLESNRELIDIVKVTNDINGMRSVEDDACIVPGVIAASTYKHSYLAPGESTEMYVLIDKNFKREFLKAQARKRPAVK